MIKARCILHFMRGHALAMALPAIVSTSVFLVPLTWASSFEQNLARLKEREAQIDLNLTQMANQTGYSGFSNGTPSTNQTNDSRKAPLLVMHSTLDRVRIPQGKVIQALLRNRLVVGSEPSPAVLQVVTGSGSHSGLKLLGNARQSSTTGRVAIELSRMMFSSGAMAGTNIKATALDHTGAAGLEAQVFSSKAIMMAGAMAGSLISGFAAAQQSQTATPFGFQQTTPGLRNGILQGVAQTTAEQSKRLIDESTTEKPVLVVEAGQAVLVYFEDAVRY